MHSRRSDAGTGKSAGQIRFRHKNGWHLDRASARRGFTIVELLVVIAILSVLAALLFPVFAQAREAGQRTTAISNVRQIVSAQLLYRSDNDDRFVLYFTGIRLTPDGERVYSAPSIYWPQTVSPYIGKVDLHSGRTQALIQDLPAVFQDPKKGRKIQDPALWPTGNISAWGMSDNIVNWFCPVDVSPTYLPVDPNAIVSSSECLLLAQTWDYFSPRHDLAGSAIAASYFDSPPYGANGAATFLDSPYRASYVKQSYMQEPDPDGLNVTAFCDGHAKSIPTGLLTHGGHFWSIGHNDAWP